jgi:transposase
MDQIVTIGLDLAKNIFQVHGIDACGKVVSANLYAVARS